MKEISSNGRTSLRTRQDCADCLERRPKDDIKNCFEDQHDYLWNMTHRGNHGHQICSNAGILRKVNNHDTNNCKEGRKAMTSIANIAINCFKIASQIKMKTNAVMRHMIPTKPQNCESWTSTSRAHWMKYEWSREKKKKKI